MCSLVEDFSDELKKKPDKKCWGCGKKEAKDGPKFRQCPRCVELKILPSLFCSDECFRKNWSRHRKEVHRTIKDNQLPKSEIEGLVGEMNLSNAIDSYERILMEGLRYSICGDYVNAIKKYRKALKKHPERPGAYGDLGFAYYQTGQREEGLRLMEASLGRWAWCCLAGQYPKTAIKRLSRLGLLFVEFLLLHKDVPSYKKPAWFLNDFIFIHVVGLMKEGLTKGADRIEKEQYDEDMRRLNLWRGCILSGLLRNGKLCFSRQLIAQSDRTSKDMKEAADCIKKALANEGGERTNESHYFLGMNAGHLAELEVVTDILMKNAKRWEATPHNSSPFYKGCFVIVFGLSSTSDKKMNRKLGIVQTSRSNDGSFAVKIDGVSDLKTLNEKNMMLLPVSDRDVGLVSCMPPAAQWNSLRPIARGVLEKLPGLR